MSDIRSQPASIDEDEYFSARGSNEFSQSQYEDDRVCGNESTNGGPTHTAFHSVPSNVEHESSADEAGDEDAPNLMRVGPQIELERAIMEDLEGLMYGTNLMSHYDLLLMRS